MTFSMSLSDPGQYTMSLACSSCLDVRHVVAGESGVSY